LSQDGSEKGKFDIEAIKSFAKDFLAGKLQGREGEIVSVGIREALVRMV